MTFQAKAFHTCEARGTKEQLREEVPFLSRLEGQWLGPGHYFWTDSDYWAHRWGSGDKIISRFHVAMEKENLLDLVGSVQDQITLRKIVDCFEDGPLLDMYKERFNSEICVSSIIMWLREEQHAGHSDIFPYWAVKAKDDRRPDVKLPFVAGRREKLALVERHQLCVYAEYKDETVTFECFIHPVHFMDAESGSLA